jgi:hypothetical protein
VTSRSRPASTLAISAAAAALVWALSPWLTGQLEPWDADGPFFAGALVVAGALAGAIAPRPIWAHYVGAFGGQVVYGLVALRVGPLFVLGAIFLLGYSLVFAMAAAATSTVRSRLAVGSTARRGHTRP